MSIPESLTLDEFKKIPVENIFELVSSKHQSVTVHLPDGNQVVIHSKSELKSLPLLKGQIPEGWKDAIYHESE